MSEADLRSIYERIEKSKNNESVGRGQAQLVGELQTNLLFSELNFDTAKAVLDYGCGIGRTMPMLFEKAGRRIELDGCDISQEFIEECRQLYAAYPFRFFKIFAKNPHYMKFWVSRQNDELPKNHYDLAYSFSVFTHLNLKMAEETLRRVSQSLKRGGSYYFTLFRIDEHAVDVINSNKSATFGFSNKVKADTKEYFAHNSDPYAFVALRQHEIEQCIAAAGFKVEKFVPGAWRDASSINLHDGYVVTKV